MNNPIIETDLAEILREIKGDQKKILEEISDIKVNQAKVEEKLKAQGEMIGELKGSQTKQIWALIALAFTAVVGLTAAFSKIVFFAN